MRNPETINEVLAKHQGSAEGWEYRDLAGELHEWARRINMGFGLHLPNTPALKIQPLKRRFGHYLCGRNGFGLLDEIAIDENHARNSPFWSVIGTLGHECLHGWQFNKHNGEPSKIGRRNYHNWEFRDKAYRLGMIVDARGFTQYEPGNTPFMNLLRKYGIEPPQIPRPIREQRQVSKTKLHLYECQCQPRPYKVRVGRAEFHARCLVCNCIFEIRM